MCDHTFNRGGHDEQSNTMQVTRPNRSASRRDPDSYVGTRPPLALKSRYTRQLSSAYCCSELLQEIAVSPNKNGAQYPRDR